MKHENALRLARKASFDTHFGGATTLRLARRAKAITGSTEAEEIVTRVYTHPYGKATYECRECGQEYLTDGEAATCCAPEYEH